MSGLITNFLLRLASFTFQKAFVFSVICGVLYYFMFFDDGSQIEAQISTLDAQIQAEDARAAETDKALQEVEQVRTTVGALSEQFNLVSKALPDTIQNSEIIRTVDRTAKASGVLIKSKEPLPPENKEYYEEVPVRVVMEGTYSELTLFLYYLANYERIMKVKNFTITQPPTVDGQRPKRLTLSGNVVSYRFIANSKSLDATGGARR